jgi:ubiquinol-cytochrome c reductase cytochrome b subunit
MGILEGSLRVMPAWEWNFLGHTITFSVLIPFALPLTIILGGAAFWPFFEQWATGDKSYHNINDRPRNAPVRTGVGVAAMTFYGVLWAEGANDVIANKLQIPLYTVTWISRVLIIVGPALGYYITKRVCLGLQRKDREMLLHGYESGIIRQLPDGEFIEVDKPLPEATRSVLEAKKVPALLPGPGAQDWNGVPAPDSRGVLGKARSLANRAFAETIPVEADGHGDGHLGNGHVAVEGTDAGGAGGQHASVALPAAGAGGGQHTEGSEGSRE